MKRWMILVVWVVTALLVQQSDYTLNFRRDFGFSSGSKVRGKFTVSVIGPLENVSQVTYRIDGQELATVSEDPFRYSFQTGEFGIGWHELSAQVTLNDNSTQETPVRRYEFVSQDEEFATVSRIIIPVGGLVLLLTVLGVGGQFLMMRKGGNKVAPGTQRNYGLRGGTVCKRCGRPYAIHLWAINLTPWRLDRCDYCGQWGLVRRQSLEVLRAAEAAEAESFKEASGVIPAGQGELSPEEQLRRQLDESKYTK